MHKAGGLAYGSWVVQVEQSRILRWAILTMLLLLGVVARIFVAWALMESSSSDHGVPCLMAKHIADGKCFPVFYYGQPYMGSLEPFVGALLSRLLGMNGFAVNMGTAIFGMALLPLVYAWGRCAGGVVAGLVALLFCVIGPFGFFQFQSWSYGGYAAIVFFCALLVFGAAWLVARERNGLRVARGWYLAFGGVAGVAWWTAPHTLPAILTAALILLVCLRRRLWGWIAMVGLVGFVCGSLPFWIWNFRHDWATFEFLASGAGGDAGGGIRVFFGVNMLRVLGVPRTAWVWGVYGGCWLVFLIQCCREICPRLTDRGLFRMALLVYLLVASLLAGGSRFAGPSAPERYLLHVIPPMAVILGCVIRLLARRLPWGVGVLPVLLLFALQLRAVPVFMEWASNDRIHRQELSELADLLETNGVHDVYAPYPMGRAGYALNFLFEERFTFSDPRKERFPPYRRKLELADSVGILNNLHGASEFLSGSGGTAQCRDIAGVTLHYNLAPSPQGLTDVSTSLTSVRDSKGQDVHLALTDCEVTTMWTNQPNDGRAEWLEFRCEEAQALRAIQLYSHADLYAYDLRLEWLSPTGEWVAARSTLPRFSSYFWSGGRPFFRGDLYRQEFRFVTAMTKAIRLHVNQADLRTCSLTEVRLYARGHAAAQDDEAVIAALAELGLDRVYADRWMANRIHEAFNGDVATTVHLNATSDPAALLSSKMHWTPTTAIVASAPMIGLCEQALTAAGFTISRRECGGRRLYYFKQGDWRPYYAENLSFIFTGVGCIKRSDPEWALYLEKHANALATEGRVREAVDTLEDALGVFSDIPHAADRLNKWLLQLGHADRAAYWLREADVYRRNNVPEQKLPVRFGQEIAFEGVTLPATQVTMGGPLDISYFWRCPPSLTPADWSVFVHFIDSVGKIAFQDDHVLLAHEAVTSQPVPKVFCEQRRVTVPASIPAGAYSIRLGVYRRGKLRRRLKAMSEYPAEDDAVRLPVAVNVVSP